MNDRPTPHRAAERGQPTFQAELSRQETRVLDLAMRGMIDKQIAEAMGLSLGTVRVYWRSIRSKSGSTRAESVAMRARRDSEASHERAAGIYQAVLRSIGVSFAVVDGSTGRVLRAEPGFSALLAASDTDLLGRSLGDRFPALAELPSSTGEEGVPVTPPGQGSGPTLRLLGERGSIFVVWADARKDGEAGEEDEGHAAIVDEGLTA